MRKEEASKAIDVDVAKLTAKKCWARLSVVISILFSILYIAISMILLDVFLFCLGLAFLPTKRAIIKIAFLIEHESDSLKISRLKSERGALVESEKND